MGRRPTTKQLLTLQPRIWRAPQSDFYDDEPLHAAGVYTPTVLGDIKAHGFDAVWLRGRLRELADSTVLPALNDVQARRRIQSLRTVIDRGRQAGLGVYLFFNEPLALAEDDAFWHDHAHLRGQKHENFKGAFRALCTSTPTVQRFMDEAVGQVLAALTGLAGVILITASEHHTHCWSHHQRRALNDGFDSPLGKPMQCPRCADREPAELVGALVECWTRAAGQVQPSPRVLAWNWSWSMWYPDPQTQVIERLPESAELLVDWERGGTRPWVHGHDLSVDEYSLSFIGPSERFVKSQQVAKAHGRPVHAKLQIGTTHEIATVPNLPLIWNLYEKMLRMRRRQVAGAMATWNFGCSLTLNSFAFGMFWQDPAQYVDRAAFGQALCRRYFGQVDASQLAVAWEQFGQAFAHYPFSIKFVYSSPINYAPALVLGPSYKAAPLGPPWMEHEFGDRFEDCLTDFTLAQVIQAFDAMIECWHKGLAHYRQALARDTNVDQTHCRQELSCARMILSQLRSFYNLARFHQWRLGRITAQNLTPPCRIALDDTAAQIIRAELDNARHALALVQADPRLGMHQECRAYFYDRHSIGRKIEQMRAYL